MTMMRTVAGIAQDQKDEFWKKTVDEQTDLEKRIEQDEEKDPALRKQFQQITFSLGKFNDEQRTFQAIASTPLVDRQGDSIDQDGWFLDNFIKNPVIPWAHDYYTPPVGRAIEIGINQQGYLQFTYQAPPEGVYDLADTVWNLYRNQFIFAFSVGFIPQEYEGNWEDGYTFTKCELLEISAVVVPANPQAVALAYKGEYINERQAKSLRSKMQAATKFLDEAMGKGALGGSTLPLADKGQEWDKSTAVSKVKAWASDEDGNIDFSKYKKAFMYVEDGGGDKQGDYKFPFATIADGELKAVWNGVKAIMSVINGGRGGADISDDDRKKIYNQVKKYYKAFDEDAPDLSDKGLTNDEDIKDNTNMTKSQKDEKVAQKGNSKLDVEEKEQLVSLHKDLNDMQTKMGAFQTKMEAHKVNLQKMLGMETLGVNPADNDGDNDGGGGGDDNDADDGKGSEGAGKDDKGGKGGKSVEDEKTKKKDLSTEDEESEDEDLEDESGESNTEEAAANPQGSEDESTEESEDESDEESEDEDESEVSDKQDDKKSSKQGEVKSADEDSDDGADQEDGDSELTDAQEEEFIRAFNEETERLKKEEAAKK